MEVLAEGTPGVGRLAATEGSRLDQAGSGWVRRGAVARAGSLLSCTGIIITFYEITFLSVIFIHYFSFYM